MVEIFVVGDGDQSFEIFAGELILNGDVVAAVEGGELGDQGEELDGAIDGEDLGLAADVAEVVVVGTGEDLSAIAAHELGLLVVLRRVVLVLVVLPWRRVVELDLSRAGGGGVAGVGVRAVGEVLHGPVWLPRKRRKMKDEKC